jgi:hypothetical protein
MKAESRMMIFGEGVQGNELLVRARSFGYVDEMYSAVTVTNEWYSALEICSDCSF